jgi:hypothetical protein
MNMPVTARLLALALALATSTSAARAQDAKAPAPPAEPPKEPVVEQVRARASIKEAVVDGVGFLVKNQNPDGSWGTGTETRGTEVYSMVPGSHDAFRVATTALCVMALREAGTEAETKDAHDRGLEYLIRYGEARRDHGALMYNIWAHIYVVQALSVELPERKQDEARIRASILWHLDRMHRYETYVGGWNYYDFDAATQRPSMEPTSFSTAAGLVALKQARDAGVEVSQPMIDRAIRRLAEMRMPTGAYLYSGGHQYRPRGQANLLRGSIGRTQSGNFALWEWGSPKVGEKEVRTDLDSFFKEHNFIEMGRKRIWPHESWYATAPYYYYFGHYYAGRLLEKLGPGGADYKERLAAQVMPFQEPDGSWFDYPMWDYHKPYGTAYAIMTLLRCR